MIQSMTSFGYFSKSNRDLSIDLEIRSLNSKVFDFNYRGPSYLIKYENDFRKILKKKLLRGKIELIININFNSS